MKALLPALAKLARLGATERSVVRLSQAHLCSAPIQEAICRYGDTVDFRAGLPSADPALPLASRREIARDLLRAIEEHRPTHVVSTTADAETLVLAADRIASGSVFPDDVRTTGILHYGYGGAGQSWKERLK
ncbi:MAG TPA: hypothetical protein VM328_11165, partial [Fimbriimonadaceae bacterium]|nr:hypothetical protein [Fimbriimonadaceae bacterium]